MPEYLLEEIFSNAGTRNEVRMRVVNKFSDENPGTGKDNLASRFTYYVETLSDGNRIYLRRPANLHNGFDFLVCVENYNFNSSGNRTRNFPKHDDIIKDLQAKKEESSDTYRQLFNVMERVYSCNDVLDDEYGGINFNTGFSADMILKTIKWLFIEQDIRYWNYSGRDMLWQGIPRL
ncbi:MAG: DNA adenine methylase [Oscillospiraceae bacterium]|nr:DNA adenine methylase [Oscillospiraceae bacterium]